ncbi:SseB family protein [Terrabacter terrae]|uniref:SseB family protein n=1 Tax=Terrabacter terrae TaxID=318434 RepID=A0ABN2TXG2_9MICO
MSPGTPGHRDEQGRPADSAGQAWEGKSIPSHGFSGDTGEADPALVAALVTARSQPGPEAEVAVLERVAQARWLVPVVAVATEIDESGPHAADTRSDMAAVTLTSPDGSRALPMFTALESLAAWDPTARPVPVRAAAAAQAAIGEECQVLIVDVASPHAMVLRPSMLWALAQERRWQPSHRDAHVAEAVRRAIEPEPHVTAHRLEPGEPAGAGVLRVVLALEPGLDAEQVGVVATRIGERIATDGETRARIDALTFALEAAR